MGVEDWLRIIAFSAPLIVFVFYSVAESRKTEPDTDFLSGIGALLGLIYFILYIFGMGMGG